MILYKNSDGHWRVPRSIYRKNGSTFSPSDSIRVKNGSSWTTIKWARNQLNAYNNAPTKHRYWEYSLNPQFLISEYNFFGGLNSEREFCFDTGLSNPGSNGRYAAGIGECTIYATQSSNNGAADCIFKPKFSLNVAAGYKYRSQVTVKTRQPLDHITARYWRLIIDSVRDAATANSVQLSEFMLFGNNGNVLTGGTYTNANGSSPSGEGPANAGDQNVSTKWLNFQENGSILNLTFSSTVNVAGYRIATANDATERDPISWRVQYSSDNTNWTNASYIIGYNTTTNRNTYLPDFNFCPTILTGFWTNTTQDTADFMGSGAVTDWSPAINFNRTTDLTDTRSPAQGPSVWDATKKILTWDITVNAAHSWARPIIKIEGTSVVSLPIYYQIYDWWIYRIS